jgi:hypothetical protein
VTDQLVRPLPPSVERLLDCGHLDDLLRQNGYQGAIRSSALMLDGRNSNFSICITGGEEVFVKQFMAPSETSADAGPNFRQALQFERFRDLYPTQLMGLGAPRLIASDHKQRLMIYELIPEARTYSTLHAEDDLTTTHLTAAGVALSLLHSAPYRPDVVPDLPHRMPPVAGLTAIPLAAWAGASGAELEAWALLQSDRELIDGIRALRRTEDAACRAPIHGDLRLDQILITDLGVHLTDFEEFRLGDPARDVGSLLGELAYRAFLCMVKDRDNTLSMDVEFTHEEIIERGAHELDVALPLFEAFWMGYRSGRGGDDPTLAQRSLSWLGWHMFDRLLAATKDRHKLWSVERAAAGIGRAMLTQPARFTDTFGLAS